MKLKRCLSWTNQAGTCRKLQHLPNDWSTESLPTPKNLQRPEETWDELGEPLSWVVGRWPVCVQNGSQELCIGESPVHNPLCPYPRSESTTPLLESPISRQFSGIAYHLVLICWVPWPSVSMSVTQPLPYISPPINRFSSGSLITALYPETKHIAIYFDSSCRLLVVPPSSPCRSAGLPQKPGHTHCN